MQFSILFELNVLESKLNKFKFTTTKNKRYLYDFEILFEPKLPNYILKTLPELK